MDKFVMWCIVMAAFVIACRAWYYEGYLAALKDVRKMFKDGRKGGSHGEE